MTERFAFFDMDDTLARGDSLIPFFAFGLKKRPICALLIPIMPIVGFFAWLRLIPMEWFKTLFYTPISGLTQADITEFFDRCILPRRIPAAWEALLREKTEGRRVVIVSASPAAYINEFERRGLCDAILASPLKNKNGRFSALPAGKNCGGKEKVRRIERYLAENGLEIDRDGSTGYGDSERDRFMLALTGTAYRVTRQGELIPYISSRR